MRRLIYFTIIAVACMTFAGLASSAPAPVTGVGDGPGSGNTTPPANNQVASRDAIGLRVIPNPEHYSPLQWYNSNIKVKGAPQSLMVDGYEAVRDGRTVYINAAKVTRIKRCNGSGVICTSDRVCKEMPNGGDTFLPSLFTETAYAASCMLTAETDLFTNIYVISFNQDPEDATTDIFGQILQYWKFNANVMNCSGNLDKLCSSDAECGMRNQVCQSTGVCATSQKACLLDSDCGEGDYCHNKKSAVIRDVRRLADLRTIKDRLEKYNEIQKTYPTLAQGTYLTARSASVWPSWQTTFKNALGADLPIDPVNKLGACAAGYEPATCWDETNKRYGAGNDPFALPAGSYAYYYQYKAAENTFKFCGLSESGLMKGQAVGSALCQINNCSSCTGRRCGTDGCGNSCGSCRPGETCSNYQCVKTAPNNQDI